VDEVDPVLFADLVQPVAKSRVERTVRLLQLPTVDQAEMVVVAVDAEHIVPGRTQRANDVGTGGTAGAYDGDVHRRFRQGSTPTAAALSGPPVRSPAAMGGQRTVVLTAPSERDLLLAIRCA